MTQEDGDLDVPFCVAVYELPFAQFVSSRFVNKVDVAHFLDGVDLNGVGPMGNVHGVAGLQRVDLFGRDPDQQCGGDHTKDLEATAIAFVREATRLGDGILYGRRLPERDVTGSAHGAGDVNDIARVTGGEEQS